MDLNTGGGWDRQPDTGENTLIIIGGDMRQETRRNRTLNKTGNSRKQIAREDTDTQSQKTGMKTRIRRLKHQRET